MDRHRAGAYLFLAPAGLWLALFILLPLAGAIFTSLFREVSFLPPKFVGLANYRWLAADPAFWTSLRFTLLFVLVSVPLELLLGLACALVLDRPLPARPLPARPLPGRALVRACVLIPWAVPAAVSGRIWELIYDYHLGLANHLLAYLRLIQEPVNWLGTAPGAFLALVAADAWKTTPFVALILLAGLAAIPRDLLRQAEVDRASPFQRFFRITLPLLRPVLVVALLFRTIDCLRVFDLIFVLTRGGPGGSTASLSLYGGNLFLAGDFGAGSAVSMVLFLAAAGLAAIFLKAGRFTRGLW